MVVDSNFGARNWDFEFGNFSKLVLPLLVRGTFAITSVSWSKTAFAITLLRLTDGWTKRFVWFIIASMNIVFFLSALFPWVSCTPLHAAWTFSVQDKKCWDQNVSFHMNLFSGAYSAAMDFVLALLPWTFLRTLQMKKKEKIGASIAMGMGTL